MITTAQTNTDLIVQELSLNGVERGDELIPNQLQRRCVGLSTLRELVNEIDLDSLRNSPFYNIITEGVRLHERFLVDTRRSLVSEVFSYGYSSVTEIVQRFEFFGFQLEGPLPLNAYTSENRLSMNTYQEMYFEDASTVTMASNMTATSPVPAADSNVPLRQLDMSAVTKATFENISDKIKIGRVAVTDTQMEEYLASHTIITAENVDKFDVLHQKMVKIMYYYKTLVLPNANLDELQHVQSLQVLLTQEMCNLGDGLCAKQWFKARKRAPTLCAKLHDKTPGAHCTISLMGLPDIVVLTAPQVDAIPDSTLTDNTDSVSTARHQLADAQFMERLKLIMESKFAAFNSGSTRVSNRLNRSTKLQLCCYSIALRQSYHPTVVKPFPLLLSDGVSGQLLLHSTPHLNRHNLFRCLPRSITSRQYVVQTLLGLFADPEHLHDWLLQHEKRLRQLKYASAPAPSGINTRLQQKTNGEGGAVSECGQNNTTTADPGAADHATHFTTADYQWEQSADSDLSGDEEAYDDEQDYDVSFYFLYFIFYFLVFVGYTDFIS